jgi:hypothetical protein
MHPIFKMLAKYVVHHAVPLDTRLAGELLRNQENAEVAFACPRRRPVTCVQVRLVDDIKPYGLEGDH